MNTRRILMFVGITYALSWALILVYALSGGQWRGAGAAGISAVYMWIPGAVAIWLRKYVDNEPLRPSLALWFKPNRWFIAAGAVPVVLAMAAGEAGIRLPGHYYDPAMSGFFERLAAQVTPDQLAQLKTTLANLPVSYYWIILIQGVVAGYTINALFALGEELGWRGYLQHELRGLGFWTSSALIGLIWGVWHWPIILMGYNYPQHPVAGVGMMVLFTVLLAPLLSYIRLRSGTVVGATIFHGFINSIAALSIIYVAGGSDLTAGLTGLAGLLVLAAADIFLFAGEKFLAEEPFVFADTGSAPAGADTEAPPEED